MSFSSCPNCPKIELRTWSPDHGDWIREDLPTSYFDCGSTQASPVHDRAEKGSSIRVIVAQAEEIRKCETCRAIFSSGFGIPRSWWTRYSRKANGYFGCEDIEDTEGNVTGLCSWARFITKQLAVGSGPPLRYHWAKLNIISAWDARSHSTSIIVFDPMSNIKDGIIAKLQAEPRPGEHADPFWVYPRLLEEVVELQDVAVWDTRDLVRKVEKGRSSLRDPNTDDLYLHEIARHVIHVNETLKVAIRDLEAIQKQQQTRALLLESSGLVSRQGRRISDKLLFFHSMLTGLSHRAEANKARLDNEIVLAFNTVAQRVGQTTVEIAREARSDNASMKTIAFVTMIFLPSTFVSAVFGTSFFSFDGDHWAMSPNFWIFWAVSIPLTAASICMWFFWELIFPPLSKLLERSESDLSRYDGSAARPVMKLRRLLTYGERTRKTVA